MKTVKPPPIFARQSTAVIMVSVLMGCARVKVDTPVHCVKPPTFARQSTAVFMVVVLMGFADATRVVGGICWTVDVGIQLYVHLER